MCLPNSSCAVGFSWFWRMRDASGEDSLGRYRCRELVSSSSRLKLNPSYALVLWLYINVNSLPRLRVILWFVESYRFQFCSRAQSTIAVSLTPTDLAAGILEVLSALSF